MINPKLVNWENVLYHILQQIGEVEGVYFEKAWDLPPELTEYILNNLEND